jgi:very-short-patch-repair endonuclease
MPKHPELQVARARTLRRDASDAENLPWRHLRDRQVASLKFRRQHELGPYIVDLVCDEARLIVEADGGQHAATIEADARRTAWLEARGYRVLRFWNNEILANPTGVLEVIRRVALERVGDPPPPHPNPLPEGERE